jgi:hypothetical protein
MLLEMPATGGIFNKYLPCLTMFPQILTNISHVSTDNLLTDSCLKHKSLEGHSEITTSLIIQAIN